MEKDITRADFLKKILGFAVDQVTNVVERRVEALIPCGLRPPWSLGEMEFMGRCEKCGGCGEICPKGIIYYHSDESYLAAGTPYLDFKDNQCDYCGECVKVCPSGALSFEFGEKELGTKK